MRTLELSELCEGIKNIFAITDIGLLSNILLEVCLRNDHRYMEAFSDFVQDLTVDWLQKVFEYYYAERKEKCQDYTPKSIAALCAATTQTMGDVVYDLCAGSGALTIQKWVHSPKKVFICEELDCRVIPILLFNMAIRNMRGYVLNRNALTLETVRIYEIISGERFSTIREIKEAPAIEASEVISNPPYNIKWDAPSPMFADERFFCRPIPPASNANFAFVLTAISRMTKDGKAAIVLPQGVLASDIEKDIREYLLDEGLLERVISLPEKMFENTSIGTCVLVFSRNNQTVKFYDCRKKAIQEQRKQNGQFGGASHENRTYVKNVNVLPESVIAAVCGACESLPGFSQEVAISDIKRNDSVIMPTRYIQIETEVIRHRPFEDIMADINRIANERSRVKITINESLAKQFGLYEVAELVASTDEAGLNSTFKLLGGKYEGKRYITISKAKNEFKLENQDKEVLSTLVNFILPMWKQHIFYLNQEENRLLAELRDAMLPELMNGNIIV